MRSELMRLKRDTGAGRTPAANSGGVPVVRDSGTQATSVAGTAAAVGVRLVGIWVIGSWVAGIGTIPGGSVGSVVGFDASGRGSGGSWR